MIYLTGDLHGDFERFRSKEMKKLKKGDTLIVCGDFGFVWDGSKKEQSILKKLGKSKYQILFIEGTHDNLDLLSQYPQEEWNGGKVRRISGSLLKLERGEVFELEGKRFFAFGAARSRRDLVAAGAAQRRGGAAGKGKAGCLPESGRFYRDPRVQLEGAPLYRNG